MRVALVHDFLKEWGGAEEVFATILKEFPEAEVFTTVSFPVQRLAAALKGRTVHTSFLQRIPFARKLFPFLIPLMPFAFEQFDFSEYDLVISDTASFAKGVIVPPGVMHISYIHTPPRFLWGLPSSRQDTIRNPLWKLALPFINRYLRHWDYLAAQRPDILIANSQETATRIETFYGRKAQIIHPSVQVELLTKVMQEPVPQAVHDLQLPTRSYFMAVTRLERYKRVDQLIEAFRSPELKEYQLIIAGKGDDEQYLSQLAVVVPNVRFVGFIDDVVKMHLLKNSLGLLNPQREDFGIAMVEALAAGVPVIAADEGGATEIVTPQSGILYSPATVEALRAAILTRIAHAKKFAASACQQRAEHFSVHQFVQALHKVIEKGV